MPSLKKENVSKGSIFDFSENPSYGLESFERFLDHYISFLILIGDHLFTILLVLVWMELGERPKRI